MTTKKKSAVKKSAGSAAVWFDGKRVGRIAAGTALRSAVSSMQEKLSLRSVTVLLNDTKVRKSVDRNRKLVGGDRVELIAKDTRG